MPKVDSKVHDRSGVVERLREDFDLAILMSFGMLAVLVVTGFAAFRLLSGDLFGMAVDLVIVAVLSAALAYAWRGGSTRRAGELFVVLAAAGCVASALVFGQTGVFWSFLVLWINFVLAGRALASLVNGMLIIAFVTRPGLFDAGTERAAYAVTAILITVYGWIFAERMAAQRRQLQHLASVDPLTGAGNRRLLQQDLHAIMDEEGGERKAVLAVLDLDHFKRVNDSRGHEAGDRALVRLVDTVRARIRKTDSLYRFGGEEFVLLLPDTDAALARRLLDDLRERINRGMQAEGDAVTVSIGAAELRANEGWSAWLRRADIALYGAKQAGRNRVMLFGDAGVAGLDRRSGPDAAVPT